MYVCISITELMVFIFIDSISLPCFQNCLVAILFSYFLNFFFFFCIICSFWALLMELMTYNVFMLQGLHTVGLH